MKVPQQFLSEFYDQDRPIRCRNENLCNSELKAKVISMPGQEAAKVFFLLEQKMFKFRFSMSYKNVKITSTSEFLLKSSQESTARNRIPPGSHTLSLTIRFNECLTLRAMYSRAIFFFPSPTTTCKHVLKDEIASLFDGMWS